MKDGIPDPNAFIQELFNLYEQSKELDSKKELTFLSVIQKDYHENYLSRLIAYALLKEKSFVGNLIEKYEKEKHISIHLSEPDDKPIISCEKNMGGRRADIFIVFEKAQVTITIENKTNTEEHDDQTKFYYEWVKKYKNGYTNLFFYLCPNYNASTANCEAYVNLKYSDLAEMIPKDTKDVIVKDLKKHIEQKLGVTNMALEKYMVEILKNYSDFLDILANTKNALRAYQNEAIEEIKDRLKEKDQFDFVESKKCNLQSNTDKTLLVKAVRVDDLISSYRLYKPKWYTDDNNYYYVEILFNYGKHYGDMRGIKFQRTVLHNGQYIVESHDEEYTFEGDDWNSWEHWKKLLVDKATSVLPKAIKEHDNYFNEHKWNLPM